MQTKNIGINKMDSRNGAKQIRRICCGKSMVTTLLWAANPGAASGQEIPTTIRMVA
jgi:hypothetical protein